MKIGFKTFLIALLALGFSQKTQALTVNLNPEGEPAVRDFMQNEAAVVVEVPRQVVWSLQNAKALPAPSFFKNTHASFNDYIKPQKQEYDFRPLAYFVKTSIVPKFKPRKPQNAKWVEDNGRVIEFRPDIAGLATDPVNMLQTIAKSVRAGESRLTLNPTAIPAAVKLSDLNNRGIETLVARGSSDFSGSSANRITNIRVGASRFDGLIVPAGQTFSFNDPLGPVDGEHGFTPELVIKYNGLVPEFGGGICQVSTTMFRAALNGGLPILERRNHSFAVKYYAPQGTDATIYPGAQDLKFLNDTLGDILIKAEISGTKLYFDFYGKADNRRVEVGEPVKYDIKSTGAFKTTLTRIVKYADGKEKKDNFISNYRPQQEFTRTTTAEEPAEGNKPPAPENRPQA